MKKFLLSMTMLLSMAVSSQAMSYEQARQQALFLADKMAYELNLTEDQYEACYEVNLDYLMSVTNQDDLYGDYWTRRNLDLGYILLPWQYEAYLAASYFYRPLYWADGFWHFGIYAHYPHRHYFYFGRPAFWEVYRGGHSWHNNGGHSWYHGRQYGHVGGKPRGRDDKHGMRDGFNRGDYGRGHDYGKQNRHGYEKRGESSTAVIGNGNGNGNGNGKTVKNRGVGSRRTPVDFSGGRNQNNGEGKGSSIVGNNRGSKVDRSSVTPQRVNPQVRNSTVQNRAASSQKISPSSSAGSVSRQSSGKSVSSSRSSSSHSSGSASRGGGSASRGSGSSNSNNGGRR